MPLKMTNCDIENDCSKLDEDEFHDCFSQFLGKYFYFIALWKSTLTKASLKMAKILKTIVSYLSGSVVVTRIQSGTKWY